jgi:hypothetical protein
MEWARFEQEYDSDFEEWSNVRWIDTDEAADAAEGETP